jgi:hypothetical protein
MKLQRLCIQHFIAGKTLQVIGYSLCDIVCIAPIMGACGGTVGSGTALQAGTLWVLFLMVLVEFFIDIILPAALWYWG